MIIRTSTPIQLFESLETLPYWRYREYNKNLLLQSIDNDFPNRVQEIRVANKMEDKSGVENACMNLLTSYELALNSSFDPQLKTFACLVKKIGGQVMTDVEDIYEALKNMQDLTYEKVIESLQEVKKN